MKVPRTEAPVIVLQDGRWFVSGGIESSGKYQILDSSEILTNLQGWEGGPSLEEHRTSHCMVEVSKNRILIAGGIKGDKVTKSAVILGLDSKTSSPVGSLTKWRTKHSCAFFENKVYLVAKPRGSRNGETEILEDGAWKEGPYFPTQIKDQGSLAVVQNQLFYSDPENFYRLSNSKWEQIEARKLRKESVLPLTVMTLKSNTDKLCLFPDM